VSPVGPVDPTGPVTPVGPVGPNNSGCELGTVTTVGA